MDNTSFPLLRLPKDIRLKVFKLALQCEYIEFRKEPPLFKVSDAGEGHSRSRRLSSLLALACVNRQVRAETRLLVWEINVFYVSLHTINKFLSFLPLEVRNCITTIGILNNKSFGGHVPQCVALKNLPNLTQIDFIPRPGGVTDQIHLSEIIREIQIYLGQGMMEDYDGDLVSRIAGCASLADN